MDKTAKSDIAAKWDGIITILIADDHPVVRRGLKATGDKEETFQVVAEAADGNEALALLAATSPQVAVIDIDMPGKNGLAVAREARTASS